VRIRSMSVNTLAGAFLGGKRMPESSRFESTIQ
jgi:hypothetical protein